MDTKKYLFVVIALLVFAAVVRAYAPFPADLIGDEATYMFRSAGYLDHMLSQLQTTPYQWFESAPWWVKLSFHDHPPLSFALYYGAFRIFGLETFVVRAIPLLLGVLSVWLVMLIAGHVGGKRASVIAGLFGATASGLIWISRVALLEATLIPFMLAAVYATLRAQKETRWWVGAGIVFGLALITKYTAIFLVPALLIAAIISWRTAKGGRALAMGACAFFLVLAPLAVYNVMLVRTRGHPDYQLSRLLQMNTPDWREDFTQGRSFEFIPFFQMLADLLSWPVALGMLVALAGGVVMLRKWKDDGLGVLAIAVCALIMGSVLTGASQARFIVPLIPFLCVIAGVVIARREEKVEGVQRKLLQGAVGAVMVVAISYSVNTHLALPPAGREGVHFARTRVMNYGYEQLDRYLEEQFVARASEGDLWEEKDGETLYVYDSSLNYFPRLWYIDRHETYQGIPFTSSQEFKKLIEEHGEGYFPQHGFSRYVFIRALPGTLRVPENVRDTVADGMAESLRANKVTPVIIERSDGEAAFEVYEF